MGSTPSLSKPNEDPNWNWKRNLQTLEERQFHMYKNGIGTDLILEIRINEIKHKIEVHSSVLISNSDRFGEQIKRWTLKKDNGKPLIEFGKDENSIQTIKTFIKTLYKNKYEPVSVEEGIILLELSDFYLCERLIDINQHFLLEKMDVHNVIEIYQCARKLKVNSEDFYEKVFEFIAANATEILTEPHQISRLNYDEFFEILKCNTLVIDELKLFETIFIWIGFQCSKENHLVEEISCYFKNLIGLIRFPLMKLEDFSTFVKSTQLLSDKEENQVYTYLCQSKLGQKKLKWKDLLEIKEKYSMPFNIEQRRISEKIMVERSPNMSGVDSDFVLKFSTDKPIDIFGLEISVRQNCWEYFGIDKNNIQDFQYQINLTIGKGFFCNVATKNTPWFTFSKDPIITLEFVDGILINPKQFYLIKYHLKIKDKFPHPCLKTTRSIQNSSNSNDSANYKSTKANFEYHSEGTCLPYECFTLKRILYNIHEE